MVLLSFKLTDSQLRYGVRPTYSHDFLKDIFSTKKAATCSDCRNVQVAACLEKCKPKSYSAASSAAVSSASTSAGASSVASAFSASAAA